LSPLNPPLVAFGAARGGVRRRRVVVALIARRKYSTSRKIRTTFVLETLAETWYFYEQFSSLARE
jgi:hypothetical protein